MLTPAMRKKADRKAFTLIELLVVVAIISLLIAILMPSLGKAREQAKSLRCKATLIQLGQTMQMYVAEYDGKMIVGIDDLNGSVIWSDRLKSLYYRSNRDTGSASWNVERPWPQLACPNSTQLVVAGGSSDFSKNTMTGETATKGYVRWARVMEPGNVFWLADGTRDATTLTQCGRDMGSWLVNGGMVPRHSDLTANVLYVDGHVSSVHPTRTNEVPTSGNKKPWSID